MTSTAEHRSPDEWHAWWSECGVPLPGEQRSGFSLETASGTDQLGIEDEASAFARLILDRKVQAPLSIGLLGDWGSGKSFFIGQIKQQIAVIKKQPRPELYSDPIEIEFNAWHASDANLWASLVTHIFDAIWDQVAPRAGNDVNAAREDLVARIQVAQGAVHESEAQVAAGEQAVATAVQKLEKARAELGWDDHAKAITKKALRELARRARWDKPLDTIKDVREATRELAASGGRLRAAANALMDRPIRRIAIPTVLLATATAALWLLLRDDSVTAQLARWSGSAAAAIGTVVVPLRLGGHKLAKLSSTLEQIRDDYDETIEDLSKEERAALADKEAKLAVAEEELTIAKQLLEKLIAQHAALDPRRRLGAFLEERVQSTIYRAQQGIISLVRKDFERLSELMRNLRREPAGAPITDEVAKEVLEADLKAQIKPFDRIILYVDDLDRCRPAHVVNMLEAVHLLLALDLFIVVVAVDARWLTRALEVHYKELLTVHGDDDDDVRASTPQNYLEKIFQITYALGPMDPTHFGRYVRSLAGEERAAETKPPITPTKETQATGKSETEQRTSGEAVQGSEVVQTAKADDAGTLQRAPAAEAPTVRIDAAEQELIEGLIPLLPTPRIAKRLVNVYRLIKSSMNSGEREQFERNGRPASCLLVLAILFGRPAVAGELLRGLNEKTKPFEDDQRTLVAAVKARQAPPDEPATLTAEWARLAATLEAMKVTATVGECRREPLTAARYSLVTGHEWHTWRRT